MEQKNKLSFADRIKKFTPMHWVLLASLLLFISYLLVMIVIWTRDFILGVPFITGPQNEDGSIGEELIAYEITIYTLFWILDLILISTFVYELVFLPIDKIIHDNINRKELMGGEVVNVHDTYKENYEGKEDNKKEPDQVEESDSEIKDLNDLLKGHDDDKKN